MTSPGTISTSEVAGQSVELLPTREALALVNIANITAVNLAIAVNAGTIGSTAAAAALQHVAGFQH
ncbi:hypothetical protein FB561_7535 [Kribbella amoyensis]|uniref:Killing trait domain-containing protein n=1 Tax=Kribbella amoyensis TaxID=996641 RepID=A0A561B101_9ACTN|nr:hypothetical protein [Kribbella amoyensis]TWD72543.1 hypothetical protein FB561_7535 [Kribbella amoyensis]